MQEIETMISLADAVCYGGVFVFWVVSGYFAGSMFDRKGRSALSGFLLGFLLGPIGVIIAAIIPATTQGREQELLNTGKYKRCPYCQEVINARAIVCPRCQRDQPEAALIKPSAIPTAQVPLDQKGDLPSSQTTSNHAPPSRPLSSAPTDSRGGDAGIFALLGVVAILLIALFGYLLMQRAQIGTPAPTPTLYVLPTSAGAAQIIASESPTLFLTFTPWITYTPSITPSPAPTKTLVPTHTPRATSTPRPTFTPRPAATARPAGVPPDVSRYLDQINLPLQDMSDGFGLLELLNSEFENNPDVYYDDTWIDDVAFAVALIQVSHEKLLTIVAPPPMADIHASVITATNRCSEATDSYINWIDTLDDFWADAVIEDMEQCGNLLEVAFDKIEVYLSRYD